MSAGGVAEITPGTAVRVAGKYQGEVSAAQVTGFDGCVLVRFPLDDGRSVERMFRAADLEVLA